MRIVEIDIFSVLPHLVLPAASLTEVGNGAELGVDGPSVKPAVIQVSHCLLRILLVTELSNNKL